MFSLTPLSSSKEEEEGFCRRLQYYEENGAEWCKYHGPLVQVPFFLSEVNSVTGVFELANNNSGHVGKPTEPEAEHDFISSPPQAGL